MIKTVMGIDLSLTSTGVIVLNEAGDIVKHEAITSKACGPRLVDRIVRYERIVNRIKEIADETKPREVCIEHYMIGGASGGVYERIELGCLVRRMLIDSICVGNVYEVPPTTLKKWATGKGAFPGGGKIPLVMAMATRWGVSFQTDDEFDAYGLSRMAHQIAGFSQPTVDHMREGIDVAVNGKAKKVKPKKVKAE